MIQLRRQTWLFSSSQPATGLLTAEAPRGEFAAPAGDSFTVQFTVNLKPFAGEVVLLDIPNVLAVRLRQHDPADRSRQNYPAFRMPDGTVPVLEATLTLHSGDHPNWQHMTLGIPLAMLNKPEGRHEVALQFAGPDWRMFVDGEWLDNDFPYGYPRWAARNTWSLNPAFVPQASLHIPGVAPEVRKAEAPAVAESIQYWLPPGHNNWVGDVATFHYGGRYHIFYLYDRRHHQSKFGCGAHYFEHLSTADFKTWTEHEAATPLLEQWECIGTGVPFVFEGRLCLSYGLHTPRIFPREQTLLPAQWEHLEKHGCTGAFKRGAAPGMPAGSTYSVCTDGVARFERSNVLFHPCENPSVYTDPDGNLRLLANAGANGIWASDKVDGGWRCINPGFPPGGDCTFFFRWGRYDYIIGGFTGLWSKPAEAPVAAYEDQVRKGLDFYDGSNVPCVTEIPGGRFLMAAWIPIRGWGGNLIIRELLQLAGGRIGSKWMPEATPATEAPALLAGQVEKETSFPARRKSFMLTFEVTPSQASRGRFGITFLPAEGEQSACELQVSLDTLRAQFAPGPASGFAAPEKSLREGGAPHGAGNYAIENLIAADRPFTMRVIVKGCDKIGGTLIDAEIAGHRTMISYRPDLAVQRMAFRTEGVRLSNVQVAPI